MEKKYFDHSICTMCGGACCQNMAGSYHPDDFNVPVTKEIIFECLKSDKIGVDWWEGSLSDPPNGHDTKYLRPRHVGEPAIKGSWGGVCVNWSKELGCSLTDETRPFQCKKLIPNYPKPCSHNKEDKADKKDIAIAWIPYQTEINEGISLYYSYLEQKEEEK